MVVYTPRTCPEGRLKCVVQAVRGRTPIAADPLWVGYLPLLGVAKLISDSLREGWRFEFDHALARAVDRYQMRAMRDRRAKRAYFKKLKEVS